jgi:F-type H+-transporting ATPase subunit gamma
MAESLQNLKRRITGVKNVNQITRAMELVAATKMRRSQEIALASRPYAFAALEMLANLSNVERIMLPPLFEKRVVKSTLYVLITSDKGLAGAFNANVIKNFEKFLMTRDEKGEIRKEDANYIAVGQKAANHLEKKGLLRAKFTRIGDYTTVEQVRPVADLLIEGFLSGEWDRVVVFSMHFRSALLQEVVQQELFPIDVDALRRTAEEIIPKTGRYAELRATNNYSLLTNHHSLPTDYIIEPSPEEILSDLARHLVEMQIYHLILEANASEHAARRAAMKSASDNAKELADGLNLQYNKSRQAGITREIIEITAGAEALK